MLSGQYFFSAVKNMRNRVIDERLCLPHRKYTEFNERKFQLAPAREMYQRKKSSRTMREESGNSKHLVLGCEFRHCRRCTN